MKRDIRFDILRTIGLLAIILAHVNPPPLLFHPRNFDVPLMVFISGAVYGVFQGKEKNYFVYVRERILRLLIPTWIFLTIYFLLIPTSPKFMLETYLLLDGIGFVWVIRVFILTALIMPFLLKLYKKLSMAKYLAFLVLFYALYELLLRVIPLNPVFFYYIFYLMPYGFVAGLGLILLDIKKKHILYLALTFFLIYIALIVSNHFAPIQNYKYPPTLYYLSYGLFISYFLYVSSSRKVIQKIFDNKFMHFLAASTLWIYLWHILFLYLWNHYHPYLPKSLQNFIVEYLIVLSFALLITYVQKKVVSKLTSKLHNGRLKHILTLAFLK